MPSSLSDGEASILAIVMKLHLILPSGLIAYIRPSSDPIYTMPSSPIAGDEERMLAAVLYVHFNVPLGLIAYSFPSHAPIYIVPSLLTAGEEYMSEPTKYTHLSLPSGLSA